MRITDATQRTKGGLFIPVMLAPPGGTMGCGGDGCATAAAESTYSSIKTRPSPPNVHCAAPLQCTTAAWRARRGSVRPQRRDQS